MSENVQNTEFAARCAALWNVMAAMTTVDRFHQNIQHHPKSVFLGHADVTICVGNIFAWKVRGVIVKMLNGKAHLDFPQEQGANGKYYPNTFPKDNPQGYGGAETRTVLTTIIFSHEGVKAAMQEAANRPSPIATSAPAAGHPIPAVIDAGLGAQQVAPGAAAIANPFEA